MSLFDVAPVDFGFCLDEPFSHSSFFRCAFSGEPWTFCERSAFLDRLVAVAEAAYSQYSIELGAVRLMEAHFYTPHSE